MSTCNFNLTLNTAAAGYKICGWPCVRDQLTVQGTPSSCDPSVEPAWDGIFNLTDTYDDAPIGHEDNVSPFWYFTDQSILGSAIAAPTPPDFLDNYFACIYFQVANGPFPDRWYLSIVCNNGGDYWEGQCLATADRNNPSGTYDAIVGDVTYLPSHIEIRAVNDPCFWNLTWNNPPDENTVAAGGSVSHSESPTSVSISLFSPGSASPNNISQFDNKCSQPYDGAAHSAVLKVEITSVTPNDNSPALIAQLFIDGAYNSDIATMLPITVPGISYFPFDIPSGGSTVGINLITYAGENNPSPGQFDPTQLSVICTLCSP